MKVVMKLYGQFILETVVLLAITLLCLQQGHLEWMGNNMPTEEKFYHDYSDFQKVYYEECQKRAPEIVYINGNVVTGAYLVSELIDAYDYAGRGLEVIVHTVLNPQNQEEAVEDSRIVFSVPGIYTVKVSAVDDGNRRSICTIRIPVNNSRGMG